MFASVGLKNVLVTNGYLEEKPWREIIPYTDAANIDVKSFDEDFYKRICGGRLDVVLRNVEIMVKAAKHVEITYLVIPTLNDNMDKISEMVDWLSAIDNTVPLHFTRYFPSYKSDIPPTDTDLLRCAKELAEKKLKHVYLGNV